MKALVVGQGGREHALVRALRSSASVTEVHAIPGSDGMSRIARCHPAISWEKFDDVNALIRREGIDLVVIGPEIPLAGGLSDALRAQGVAVFGPSAEAALLESSKVFSKEFMIEAGVPTARSEVVASVEDVRRAATHYVPPYVLKADGLAAGKGVVICKTMEELEAAAHDLFVKRIFRGPEGDAGSRALLEEFSPGYEISYLVLTNGRDFEPLIPAQDHKRLRDGDEGPNTGGMGVVAPVHIDPALRERIDGEITRPVIRHLEKRGLLYRGVLYIGLMITPHGPSVIEFNVRFGDPEAQVILPLLNGDWAQVFQHIAWGELPRLRWKKMASACVVLAAEGYPDSPVKGAAISGDPLTESESRYFLHAGTQLDASRGWTTVGGRVLNAIGLGDTLSEAVNNAYAQAREASWTGLQLRQDIGAKLLR